MRRTVPWTGVLLTLGLGLSGIGTLAADKPVPAPARQKRLPVANRVVPDPRKAVEPPPEPQVEPPAEDFSASGEEVHEPLPVPRMPMPPDFVPPAQAFAEEAPEVPFDVPSPLITLGFRGLGDNGSYIPPDTHGAVGPNNVVTTLNSQYLVQDRTGNPQLTATGNLVSFWTGVQQTGSVFDPRVIYDPYQNRWIWVAAEGPGGSQSAVLVAASSNSTPTRGPYLRIPSDVGVWADFPTVGFNKNWVVVQVNMFDTTLPYPFVRSNVYILDKARLYAGTLTLPQVVTVRLDTLCGGSNCGGTQTPALTYDNTTPDLYLVQMWNEEGTPGTGYLRLYQVTDPGTGPVVVPLGFPSGPAWSFSEATGADFAPQPPSCGGHLIQTNDARIQSVVYRNGKLWAAHTTFYPSGGVPTRAAVQWWQINTDATVAQRGVIEDPFDQLFYAFPSIAVNKDDHALLGFSTFSDTSFASASYAFRLATDPPGRMRTPAVLHAGEACYYKIGGGTENRWGDYSATAVDPTDDTKLWTVQEYAASTNYLGNAATNVWGTWWGMLDPTPLVSPTTVSIWDASVPEGDVGTRTLGFDVSLSQPSASTVTVPWSTADGAAKAVLDNDYVPVASGLLVFNPGETLKSAQVTVNGDIKHEGDETFTVNLGVPTGATVATGTATGTILNDDAVPQASIVDLRVVEGNTGASPYTLALFKVALSNPSDTPVNVSFATSAGTATSGTDFVAASGTVTFPAAVGTGPYPTSDTEQTVPVQVFGDTSAEPDETFFVGLSSPSGCTLLKTRGTGTILDDDTQKPDVAALAVVSDSDPAAGPPPGPTDGRDRLEWVNVPSALTPTQIQIGWTVSATTVNAGGTCTDPASPTTNLACSAGVCPTSFLHSTLQLDHAYCYKVWVDYGGSPSTGVSARGVPFDAWSGKVRWRYFRGTGATGVAPPTVGSDAVLGPSNDGLVHGMLRGPAGGLWPGGWAPVNLGSPVQARSPIVPMAGGSRAFFATQDGWVHAVDTQTGAIIWETQLQTPLAGPIPGQAAPAGIFVAFGGTWDYLLVGTRDASNPNYFYALSPLTGAVLDQFPKAGEKDAGGALIGTLGIINGMAGVDYQRKRVCFGTIKSTVGTPDTRTLWCLNLGPPGDALSYGWALDQSIVGDIDGSPIIRGNRLYVGNTTGVLWALDPDDPLNAAKRYSVATGDGGVKDFPFPNRPTNTVYFSTTNQVHACLDTGSSFNCTSGGGWTVTPASRPSPVLFSPGTVYAGGASGQLFELNAADGTALATRQLDNAPSPATIGTPSLDAGYSPNIVLVGSTNGIFYAVEVP
jgi:outer membrane protein assembly factor BamB